MAWNCDDFFERLEEYSNILEGILLMRNKWESNKRLVKSEKDSIAFVYKGSLVTNHVFRITFSLNDNLPKLMAYSGDPQQAAVQKRPGSPLLSGASPEQKNKIKVEFGMTPSRADETGDWSRDLQEDIPKDFYLDFINHAMRMSNMIK